MNYKTTVAGQPIDVNPDALRAFLHLRDSENPFVCFPGAAGHITGSFSNVTVEQIHEHYFGSQRNPFKRMFKARQMSAMNYVWYRFVLDCILPLVTRGRSMIRFPHLIMMYALEQRLDIDIALHVFSSILHYSHPSGGKLHMPFGNIITKYIASRGIDISVGTIRPLSKDYDQLGARHLKLAKIVVHDGTLVWSRNAGAGAAEEESDSEEEEAAPTETAAAASSIPHTDLDARIAHLEERVDRGFRDMGERIQGYYDNVSSYRQEVQTYHQGVQTYHQTLDGYFQEVRGLREEWSTAARRQNEAYVQQQQMFDMLQQMHMSSHPPPSPPPDDGAGGNMFF